MKLPWVCLLALACGAPQGAQSPSAGGLAAPPAPAEAAPQDEEPRAEAPVEAPLEDPEPLAAPPAPAATSDVEGPSPEPEESAEAPEASAQAPEDEPAPPAPSAPTTILAPARPGRIDPARMRRVLRGIRDEINGCYAEAIQRRPMAGTLRVRFLIGPRGRVESAEIYESELDDDAMHACVLALYRDLRFPRPRPRRSSVLATFPYTFATE